MALLLLCALAQFGECSILHTLLAIWNPLSGNERQAVVPGAAVGPSALAGWVASS